MARFIDNQSHPGIPLSLKEKFLEAIPLTYKKEMVMPTAKERMTEIIRSQPEDSSFEEILRELAFHNMCEISIW